MVTGFGDGLGIPDGSDENIDLVMHKPVPRRELRRGLASVMGEIVSFDQETFTREPLRAAS